MKIILPHTASQLVTNLSQVCSNDQGVEIQWKSAGSLTLED